MKKSLFAVFFMLTFLPLIAQDGEQRVSVGFQPFQLQGDRNVAQSVAETIETTLRLSFILMGTYSVLEADEQEWGKQETLADAAREFSMDNIVTGRVIAGEGEYAAVIELSVYSRADKAVVVNERMEISSFLDIFDATDDLTLSLLEGFTEGPLTVGSLNLITTGASRTYYVEIGGEVVGEQLFEISPLPAGDHHLRVYEIIRFREVTVLDEIITIDEGETTIVEFSLLSDVAYENLASRNEVLLPAGSFSSDKRTVYSSNEENGVSVDISSFYYGRSLVTVGEIAEVLNASLEDGTVFLDRKGVFLNRDNRPVLLYDLREGVLQNRRKAVLVEDGHLVVREGFSGRPVNSITWYGAVFFANYISVREGLTPCYSLDDWSCDFSANGFRLPTEAELVYAQKSGSDLVSSNQNHWGNVEFLWTWDWYRNRVKLDEKEQDPLGPRDGLQIVARSLDERELNDPRFGKPDVGFRLVRSADNEQRLTEAVEREEISRNGIEPSILLGLWEGRIQYLGVVGHYHRTVTNMYSFSAGIGFGLVPASDGNNGPNESMFLIDATVTPVMIGNKARFAAGVTFDLVFSPVGQEVGNGSPFIPLLSLQVYFRNISFYFMPIGLISMAMESGNSDMDAGAVLVGAGYYFDL